MQPRRICDILTCMDEKPKIEERLDPEVAKYLKHVRARPPAHTLSIEELRRDIDQLRNVYPPKPVGKIENIEIPGPAGKIPVRVYTPKGNGPFPPVVFYHGGGWCIGSLDGYDGLCAELTNRTGAVVFSVDYRLAPEHVFPAAFEDSYAALKFVSQNAARFNAQPEKLIVMGDSAGATLAAAVSIKSKEDAGPRIALQILAYPATDISRTDSGSYRLFGRGYDLDKEGIEKYRAYYMPDKKDWTDPHASPMLARDLHGLPRALIITAEFDPLRDDGKEFAEKLKSAGVPVKYSMYKGVIHGFLSFITFNAAQKAFDEISSAVK